MESYMNEENKSRGRGRPRLEETMKPEWYNIIIESGKEGKHITEVLNILGISWNGHYALLKRSKQYSQAYSEFLKLAEDWWYMKAYNSMVDNNGYGFNTRLWETIMKNRFKDNWKSEKHIDVTTQGEKIEGTTTPIQIEIIKKQVGQDGTEGEL